MSPGKCVLGAGAGLIAFGLTPIPSLHASRDLPVILGLALVVGWAAAVAAGGRSEESPGARKETTLAVLTLSTLILAPFGAVGVLLVAHADPLATFLSGVVLLALAGILVILFAVVFFATRRIQRRAPTTTGRQ